MVSKFLRKKSKRVQARKRYKIEKKVREHNRKIRKSDKKVKHKKKNLVLPHHIPNECPFKDQLIEELTQLQEVERAERIRQKSLGNKNELAEKAEEVKKRLDEFAEVDRIKNEIELRSMETEMSMKTHYREFKKVFEAADVLLHVVDARDPLGTRCLEIEEAVRMASDKKRLIFLLNKADLIPRENLDQWLKYFRVFAPCIPFKASLQSQRSHLGQRRFHDINDKSMSNSVSAGADLLMSILNNYCRNKNIKTSITVGVVGLPNVGKSSVINTLKRSRACDVGAIAGVTRNLQIVQIDSKIQIIDSPGVVFSSINKSSSNSESLALKNAMNSSDIQDPVAAASLIIQKIDRKQLIDLYGIICFQTPEEFLILKAQQMGKVRKGGISDTRAVSLLIIDDWNRGKIKHSTVPPELNESDIHLGAEIVKDSASEFDIDNCIVNVDQQNNNEPQEPLIKNGMIEIDGKMLKVIGKIKKQANKKNMKKIGHKLKKLNV